MTKSRDKVSKLFEFYKSLYETIFHFSSLPDNVEQSLKRIVTYEIFQYQIDASLVDKERLRVDHVIIGSPGEGSFAGENEAIHSLAQLVPYVIERISPSERTRLLNEGIRLDNKAKLVQKLKGIKLHWKGIKLHWKGIKLHWKGIEPNLLN